MESSSPPTDDELLNAVLEVLDEPAVLARYPNLTEGDLVEHPSAWLQAASDSEELFTLDLYRGGWLEFTWYADLDMEIERFKASLSNVTIEQCFNLWRTLRDGEIEKIKAVFEKQSPAVP
jgi:hypothetical protein